MEQQDDRRWFHVIVTAYGTWLSGDERGFRTRDHRIHVEGDYKNPPPPGEFARWLRFSRRHLKQDPVVLGPEWLPVVGDALRRKLEKTGAMVVCAAMARTHGHLLVKMPPKLTKTWVGMAKLHALYAARGRGWAGELWAGGCKCDPVNDREHHRNTFLYILDHVNEGAWTWDVRTPPPPT